MALRQAARAPRPAGAAPAYRDEWQAVLDDPAALARFEPYVAGPEFLEPGRGRAAVLADGIMGSRDGVPVVASPMHKQEFDLRTGACLDDPEVSLPVLPVPPALR
ncbi:nitrite reductase (NAD(P)H) small subunit [Streptomyces gardneri]|uniref:nitrite reductase (NAD(P)H) small subunit n=1 Tax=Streptomyces gardneri TaxID=66892 RepID=UPI0037D32D28